MGSETGTYFFDRRLATSGPLEYVTDKERSCRTYINYMNIRLQKMFHYEGLPDSLPKEMLEYYLLNNGTCYIVKENDKLYAVIGSFGGPPDPYYRPTLYVVANPGLRLSKTYNLQEDGVLMRNDTLWVGLYPLMGRYASLMAENLLTLRTADVMLRVMAMLTAPDDKTKIAAEEYLKNLEKGKLGVIGENRFFDEGVKMQTPPSNNGSYLTQFIELHQYLIGTFYNEIGINANFNMKREAIGDGESALNENSLLPLCEEMLRCRKEDIDKVNKKFDTNITVEFDSVWAANIKELELGLKKLENEANNASQLGGNDGEREGSNDDNTSEPEVGTAVSSSQDDDDGPADTSDNKPDDYTGGNVDEGGSTEDVEPDAGDDNGDGSDDKPLVDEPEESEDTEESNDDDDEEESEDEEDDK